MSAVREPGWVGAGEWALGVRGLRAPSVGDRGDDLSSHPDPAAAVVRGGVADDQPEARDLGARGSALARAGFLPDRVGDAAPLSRGDGSPGRERLAGHVEVDEGYLGGVEGGVDGRKTETKAIVAIAVEIKHPKGFGRIRLKHVPDVSAESLLPFIDEAVQAGATIHRDGWQAYWKLGERGYGRRAHGHASAERSRACRDAGRAPRREPAGALAARRPPGPRWPRASRRLPERVSRSALTDAPRGVAGCRSTDCSNAPSPPTRSPTAASWSTRPRPAADHRAHQDPAASPTFRQSIAPGAKTPQLQASLTQMDNPFPRQQGGRASSLVFVHLREDADLVGRPELPWISPTAGRMTPPRSRSTQVLRPGPR